MITVLTTIERKLRYFQRWYEQLSPIQQLFITSVLLWIIAIIRAVL